MKLKPTELMEKRRENCLGGNGNRIEKKKSSNGFYPPVPRLCNSCPIFNFFENIHGIHGQQQVGKREHTENSIEEELPCWKFSVGRKNSAKLLYYSQAHDCKFPFPSSPPHDFFTYITTHLKKYLPEYDVLSFCLNSLRCVSILIAFPFPEFGFLWIAGKLSPFCSKDRSFFPRR